MKPYLFQQPPFRFVSALVEYNRESATSEYIIPDDAYFVRDGRMEIAGLMENMAQTCSAWAGQKSIDDNSEKRFAPLCAISHMQVNRFPCVGEVLMTHIHLLEADFGVLLLDAVCRVGNEVVAMCKIKVGM